MRAAHLVESMNARDGLFDDAFDRREQRGIMLVAIVCEIAAIVEDHIRLPALFGSDRFLDAPPEVIVCFTFPCEDWNGSFGESGGYFVLQVE